MRGACAGVPMEGVGGGGRVDAGGAAASSSEAGEGDIGWGGARCAAARVPSSGQCRGGETRPLRTRAPRRRVQPQDRQAPGPPRRAPRARPEDAPRHRASTADGDGSLRLVELGAASWADTRWRRRAHQKVPLALGMGGVHYDVFLKTRPRARTGLEGDSQEGAVQSQGIAGPGPVSLHESEVATQAASMKVRNSRAQSAATPIPSRPRAAGTWPTCSHDVGRASRRRPA